MKHPKTPLRYPGGKSKAIKQINSFLDKNGISEYREPFLGGGSIALNFSKDNPEIKIWVNDIYYNLYIFWKILKNSVDELHYSLKKMKENNNSIEKSRILFLKSKELILEKNISNLEIAIRFYIINKCSFSGLTESSAFSKMASQKNFTLNGIDNLYYFSKIIKNWKITNYSYEELLINTNKNVLIYLDPPYAINSYLYGKKGKFHENFNHNDFIDNVKKTNAKCVISYNNSSEILKEFNDNKWKKSVFNLTYTMRSVNDYMENQKQRKELLLNNFMNYQNR